MQETFEYTEYSRNEPVVDQDPATSATTPLRRLRKVPFLITKYLGREPKPTLRSKPSQHTSELTPAESTPACA